MDRNDAVRIEHYRRWLHPDWERFVHPAQRAAMRKDFALRDRAFETARARRRREQNEAREREEQEAVRAAQQREIEREALTLKADLAWVRFELAMVDLALRRKAFDPSQPRVPAGNSILSGRWTDDPQLVRVAASGKLPPTLGHNSGNFDIPPDRPDDSRERTGAIRAAARVLAKIPGPIGRAAALVSILEGASWLREHQAEIETQLDPPKTLEELQQAVDIDRPGTQKHHILEQRPAEKEGFPRSQIDAPDNLVRIPKQKHQEISEWFSRKNFEDQRFDGQTPRDSLRDKSWEERRELGLEVLEKFGVLKR